jgi:hypothetical protein
MKHVTGNLSGQGIRDASEELRSMSCCVALGVP